MGNFDPERELSSPLLGIPSFGLIVKHTFIDGDAPALLGDWPVRIGAMPSDQVVAVSSSSGSS